mmetsp:Transcript_10395/g.31767  ORF Transcript_10395/g.31767 Transcript_10395/m.31767 type:complete len:254 (+) Transcript_10395:103-864(+)|eukprot:CAMPEP_0198734086 /NCGR_PEP_ID=MMETSP1475-20131203/50341_1 /TAXON_ID= ORGANISM="Unidentified sp., Strain CCMP1999" /NCGR_SAMPLE_ID=MMETSP1475 /ASSEMBLY_ACC=CAM_ASM_001111 /LENGTH=253 /DNA_ID=CAMNT_0044497493 /DNA_START=112 /DNA_END=873 /DNA_ORIENTATION=-
MAIYTRNGRAGAVPTENAVVVGLREKISARREELRKLQAELDVKRNATGENGGASKKVFSMWESGDLFKKDVARTVVDVKGDVKGASENFKKVNEASYKPKANTPVKNKSSEETFKPPSWAFAEKAKVIQKEDAKSSIGTSVSIENLKTSVTTAGDKEAKKEWSTSSTGTGNLSSLMSKFNNVSVEDSPRKQPSVPKSNGTHVPRTFLERWPNGEPGPKLLPDYLNDLIEDLDAQITRMRAELEALEAAQEAQ